MNKRMVAFVVIVVALIVGPALPIAQLSSDLGLFFPWVASIIGLAFVALGLMDPAPPCSDQRAGLVLFGLASIILAPRPSDPTTPE